MYLMGIEGVCLLDDNAGQTKGLPRKPQCRYLCKRKQMSFDHVPPRLYHLTKIRNVPLCMIKTACKKNF